MNRVKTEDCFIASIDLLGAKNLISRDENDDRLNEIRNIYKSWKEIKGTSYFSPLKVKFFSDNVVIAIRVGDTNGNISAADCLLEFTAYMADHMLSCNYKPRGGICKGSIYMDDVFVWGKGLVDAYIMESKKAKFPRIIISSEVLNETSDHLKRIMIQKDADGEFILNYLKSFGRNKDLWVSHISKECESLQEEIKILQESLKIENNIQQDSKNEGMQKAETETEKILDKLKWLQKFEETNLEYWKQCLPER